MVVHELTEQECLAILAGTNVARLACALDNQPYVVPIHVHLEGEFLYSYATEGQKIEWMRRNPLVCLEVAVLSSPTRWSSVVVFGRYEELPRLPEYKDARLVAQRLFQGHLMWWQPASVPLAGREYRNPVVFRIRIRRVTGRRGADDALTTAHMQENASHARRRGWLESVLGRGSWRP